MHGKRIESRASVLVVTGIVLLGVLSQPLHAQGQEPTSTPLSEITPAGAVGFVELSGLDSIITRVQQSTYAEQFVSHPRFREFQTTPQYRRFNAARQIVETQLGMDAVTAIRKLLGGRVGLSIYPRANTDQPDVLLVIRVNDADTLSYIRERVDPFLQLAEEQIARTDSNGGEIFDLDGGKAYVFWRDRTLLATNNEDLLQRSLSLLSGQADDSLENDADFQLMVDQMGAEHVIRGYVHLAAISRAEGGRFFPLKLDNPLASLLFAGASELIVRSPYAGLVLDVDESEFHLTAGVAGGPDEVGENYDWFFSDPESSGAAAIPHVSELIAGFSLHRNFSDWYRLREDLLVARMLPQFDKFEAGLGNLLPGKDFGQDVLPLVGKNITFVAAPQSYDYLDGEPGIKFPGMGLIVDLSEPQEGADVFQMFFQTLSAILNLQAGQQGRLPMVMASESYNGVQLTYGRFLQKPTGERLPFVFNFMPASALVGDRYVVCSSRSLCRQLVDALQSPSDAVELPNRNFDLEFFAAPFADILQANTDFFRAQSIKEGKSSEQAREEFETVLDVIRRFNSFRLNTTVNTDTFQVHLEGDWK